jgi:uncharacterized protein
MNGLKFFLLGLTLSVTIAHSAHADSYADEINQWHTFRVQKLTAPDGWLSLAGLKWLKPGINKVGTARDNDIILPKGPSHLGTVTWKKNTCLTLAKPTSALIDGKNVSSTRLVDDIDNQPTLITFDTITVYLVTRENRKGLRIKDSQSRARLAFHGLTYFPIDPSWKIEAKWIPFDPPITLSIDLIIGTHETDQCPGKAIFQRDGLTYELYPILESPKSLFFIIKDGTNGKETDDAARFLNTDLPHDGKLTLDFNKLINPPCAFTPYAACPLPPEQNRLTLRITAGEKKYD